MTEMADGVLEISSASARRFYNAIVNGFEEEGIGTGDLKPIHSLAGLATDNRPAGPNELLANRVAIGEKTGFCPRSGVTLQLIKLEKDQRKQLLEGLIQLSKTRFEEFKDSISFTEAPDDYAAKNLNAFADWLK